MSVQNHIAALKKKHADLDDEIRAAEARPGSDDLEIAALKKEKLRIKDEIHQLST